MTNTLVLLLILEDKDVFDIQLAFSLHLALFLPTSPPHSSPPPGSGTGMF